MVVKYASGGEGSWASFFITLPRVICTGHPKSGSVLPFVLPQVAIVCGLAVLAQFHNPLHGLTTEEGEEVDIAAGVQVIGILLSFLMVFKTQSAYAQFWTASRDIQSILAATRHLCRLMVTSFDWEDKEGDDEAQKEANAQIKSRVRKVLRLLVMNFFVLIEYFQRTGDHNDEDLTGMDESQMRVLRHNVFKLTGGEGEPFQKGGKLQLKDEFNLMYRTEAACQGLREGLSKAESERHPWLPEWKLLAKRHNPKWSGQALPAEDIEAVVEQEKQDLLIHVVHAANPMLVVFWIQIVMKRLSTDSRSTKSVPDPDHPGRDMQVPRHGGGIAPPLEGQFYANIEKIELIFGSLELIDKTQFPFPYAQIMKILLYFWMLVLPFILQLKCGSVTPAVVFLIAIGFFGLDEVAEILESPFGNDPNDIDLIVYADDLVSDIEQMFEKQNMPLKPVLQDTKDDRSTFTQLRLDTTDSRIRRKNKDKEMTMQRARSRAGSAFAGLAQSAAEPSEGASAETERMLSEPDPEPEPQMAVEEREGEAQAQARAPLPAKLGEGQPHEAEPRV